MYPALRWFEIYLYFSIAYCLRWEADFLIFPTETETVFVHYFNGAAWIHTPQESISCRERKKESVTIIKSSEISIEYSVQLFLQFLLSEKSGTRAKTMDSNPVSAYLWCWCLSPSLSVIQIFQMNGIARKMCVKKTHTLTVVHIKSKTPNRNQIK